MLLWQICLSCSYILCKYNYLLRISFMTKKYLSYILYLVFCILYVMITQIHPTKHVSSITICAIGNVWQLYRKSVHLKEILPDLPPSLIHQSPGLGQVSSSGCPEPVLVSSMVRMAFASSSLHSHLTFCTVCLEQPVFHTYSDRNLSMLNKVNPYFNSRA